MGTQQLEDIFNIELKNLVEPEVLLRKSAAQST